MFTNACGATGWTWTGRTHNERVCCRSRYWYNATVENKFLVLYHFFRRFVSDDSEFLVSEDIPEKTSLLLAIAQITTPPPKKKKEKKKKKKKNSFFSGMSFFIRSVISLFENEIFVKKKIPQQLHHQPFSRKGRGAKCPKDIIWLWRLRWTGTAIFIIMHTLLWIHSYKTLFSPI